MPELNKQVKKLINAGVPEEEIASFIRRYSGRLEPATQTSLVAEDPQRKIDLRTRSGRIVIGGGLDFVRGAIGLPFDIISAFGEKRAADISKKIRHEIPQVESKDIVDDLGKALVQYGIPTGVGLKLVGNIVKGSNVAIRIASGLLTGGISDFIAATPEEKSLYGAFGGGQKDKSAFRTKLEIGVEGVLIPTGISTITGGGKIAGKIIKRAIKPDSVIEAAVGNALRNQAVDANEALFQIRTNLAKYQSSQFKPTTGIASGDLGLISMEKAVSTAGESAAEFGMRKELNMQAISDELKSVTDNLGGTGWKAQKYFNDYIEAAFSGAKKPHLVAQRNLAAIELETENFLSEFAKLGGAQAEASIILDTEIKNTLDKITLRKNELFKAIDPDNKVVISKERIKDAFTSMMERKSSLDFVPAQIPGDLEGIVAGMLKSKEKLTFGALQDIRPRLSEIIANARANNQGGAVERLTAFKKAVEAETEILSQSGVEAGQAAKNALDFYNEEYIPRFKEGIGKLYRKAQITGSPWAPTDVGRRFLEAPTGSSEAASQLKILAEGKGSDNAIRNYLVSTVADTMQNVSGKTSLKRLDNFLNKRKVRETLAQYPEIQKEISGFRNSLSKKTDMVTDFEKQVENAKEGLAKTVRDLKQNAAKYWVNANPVKAVSNVLNSSNPAVNMQQLVKLAHQDGSGEAIKGLKAAVSDFIEQNVRGSKEYGVDPEVMLSKVDNFFNKNKEIKKALSYVYTPDEIAKLNNVRSNLMMLNRINKQVTAGSPTAPILQNIQGARIVLASLYGIVKGRGIFMISKWIYSALGMDPIPKARKLISDALLDPEVAEMLMTKVTLQTEQKIAGKLAIHLVNNMLINQKGEDQ